MGLFLVRKVANKWAVVNNGIILQQLASSAEAIHAAVYTASRSAVNGRTPRVVVEQDDDTPRLVWDSTQAGSGKGEQAE